MLEFFGKEDFWHQEYEVVQKGKRKWTGPVWIAFDKSSSDVPFYGYQVSDGEIGNGKFQVGDTLTMKSCIDSIEQGINYCLFKKYCFNEQFKLPNIRNSRINFFISILVENPCNNGEQNGFEDGVDCGSKSGCPNSNCKKSLSSRSIPWLLWATPTN